MERNKDTTTIQEVLSLYGKQPDVCDVELTEEETAEAIHQAKVKKLIILENKHKEKIREEFNRQLSQPFSPKELSEYVLGIAGNLVNGFVVSDEMRPVLNALCFYFTGSSKFEDLNPDWKLSKGLFLWGNIGVGKTTLMHIFSRNKRQCFQVISCRKFSSEYAKHGDDVIDPYRNILYSIPGSDNFLQKQTGVCFDDLGTERDAMNYGNRKNIMEEILLDRYDNKVPYYQTHITTNLSADDIEQRYGTRVRSRMREMFNMIELNGIDLRK